MLVHALLLVTLFTFSLEAQNTPSVAVVIGDGLITSVGATVSATIEQKVASTHPPPYVVNNGTPSLLHLLHLFPSSSSLCLFILHPSPFTLHPSLHPSLTLH